MMCVTVLCLQLSAAVDVWVYKYIKVNERLLERARRHVSAAHVIMYACTVVTSKSRQLLTDSSNPMFHKHHAS